MALSSKIIFCKNIKLDKNNYNVLTYSESDMITLVNSTGIKIAESNDYSFIGRGDRDLIDVQLTSTLTYQVLLQCNYIAFQNTNYCNKWYFAFIDKIEYINNGVARLHYTVDIFHTWYDYWSAKACYVIREHVNNDTVGLHTIPENLETGEYICNSHYKDSTMDSYASDLCFIMASTSEPVAGVASETVAGSQIYNGIYTGLTYYRYDETSPVDILLEIFAQSGKTDAINGIFMAPKWLAPLRPNVTYREVNPSNSPLSFTISVTKQTTSNGYSPVNNKVKCFPYNYLLVSNNVGQNGILHYEKFSGTNATFTIKGVLNPGCSINLTPTNYNGNTSSDIDSIQLGKFPICNFQNDMYTNWLTQNSINVLGQTITTDDINIATSGLSAIASTITNLAVGNYMGAGMSVAGSVMQQKQHNMIPPTVSGQLNSADVNVASGNNTFHFYKMSIKDEMARVIDNYFSKYGYKINRMKLPNQTGRTTWNYVQIGQNEILGYQKTDYLGIPPEDLIRINQLYERGITLWHNHSTLGDYTQTNSITT